MPWQDIATESEAVNPCSTGNVAIDEAASCDVIGLTFVEMVKHRMDELGWSGHDLAAALGYSSSGLVYRVLEGEQKPPLKRIADWSKALRFDADQTKAMRLLAEREHIPLGMRARLVELETEADRLRKLQGEQDVLVARLRDELKRCRERLRGGDPTTSL